MRKCNNNLIDERKKKKRSMQKINLIIGLLYKNDSRLAHIYKNAYRYRPHVVNNIDQISIGNWNLYFYHQKCVVTAFGDSSVFVQLFF